MERQKPVETFEAKDAVDLVRATQPTKLDSGGKNVTCVISLRDFVVVGCKNGKVQVYDRHTSGAARGIFSRHSRWVVYLTRLEDDLVASVDWDGYMFTWRPSNVKAIGKWKFSEEFIGKVARLDDERLIVGTDVGNLIVLVHSHGVKSRKKLVFMGKHKNGISGIYVSNSLIISSSTDRTVSIWDKSSLNHLQTLRAKDRVNDIAISDKHIVMVCDEGRICLHQNAAPYALDFILETRCIRLYSVVCLNSDIFAVAGSFGHVSFLSSSKKSIVTQVQVSSSTLTSLAVLGDNRIAVAGPQVPCTLFYPPEKILLAVNDYIRDMYGIDSEQSARKHPVLDAWHSVHEQSLSLLGACETVIKSENTTRSLSEWCMAHDLLMQAVHAGVISQSRHYKGTTLHWHCELYGHCDKMAIGQKEIYFLLLLFREAESVSVIAKGTSESFIYAIRIRKDIDKDKWYSANAIYQLFLRQAESDRRLHDLFLQQSETETEFKQFHLKQVKTERSLKQVLHYQRIQRLTSIVNAILGFVPIGGSLLTNILSGGAAILNDFQVCGLVESLMGVSKELCGGFRSNKLVDLFVCRGNEILREDHWNNWDEEKRQVIQDVAQILGLTVEELRIKLRRAKEMMNTGHMNDQEENDTEVAVVREERKVSDCMETVISRDKIMSAQEPVKLNDEVGDLNVNLKEAQAELERWGNESLNRGSIELLKGEQAASCLAAFLTNYDERHVTSYIRLKEALWAAFSLDFIDGSSFVYADEAHLEELLQVGMSAIAMVAKGLSNKNLSIRYKLFLQHVVGV